MCPIRPFAASILTLVLASSAVPAFGSLLHTQRPDRNFSISFSQNAEAPNVSIAGMVKTPQGRGIKGAYIVIRDASTNEVVRATYSSTFGYYRLEQIETGRTYVLSIKHRRYLFALPAQLLELNEDRSGVDFVGEPSED